MWSYIVLLLKAIIDEPLYDARLASAGIAEQDGLEGALAHRRGSYRHLNNRIRSQDNRIVISRRKRPL